MLIEIAVVVGVLFVGGLIFPRSRRLMKGAVGMLFSNVEEANPELLFQAAQTDFNNRMATYNKALAQLGGVSEQLKRQINTKQEKLDSLTSRIQANVDAGNNDQAATLAGQHESLESDLAKDKEQFTGIENAYKTNVQNIKNAQTEYQKKVQSFKGQLAQAKIDEALGEAGAALNNVAFSANDVGSSFSRAEEIIAKKSADAAGKARVVRDLGASSEDVQMHDAEQKALDKAALAKFMAKKGQTTSNATTNGQAEKQMGPMATN